MYQIDLKLSSTIFVRNLTLKDIDEPEVIGKSYHDVTVIVDGKEYNLFKDNGF